MTHNFRTDHVSDFFLLSKRCFTVKISLFLQWHDLSSYHVWFWVHYFSSRLHLIVGVFRWTDWLQKIRWLF